MRRMAKTALAFVCVALVLGGVLLGLEAAREANDDRMLSTLWPVPVQGGLLGPDTETIPLAAALWQRTRFYTDWSFFGTETGGDASQSEDQQQMETLCTTLQKANVLPSELAAVAHAVLAAEEAPLMQVSGALGFVAQYSGSMQAELWNGLATNVSLYWSGDSAAVSETPDYNELAQNYIDYLGLSMLTDWEAVSDSLSRGKIRCARYSESAQLYIYVRDEFGEEEMQLRQYRAFACGVSSVPPQTVARTAAEVENNLLQSRVS